MHQTEYQKRKILELKKEAYILHTRGLTTRVIGKALTPKRSHGWVAEAIKEIRGMIESGEIEDPEQKVVQNINIQNED